MLRLLHFLAVVSLIGAAYAAGQEYAGPNALGPFRIDKDVSMRNLFERLGRPSSAATGDAFCYQSKDSEFFLILTRMADAYDRKIVGDMTLSNFCNCVDQRITATPDDLAAWKTERGIGIGNTADDVRKAYGKPSKEDKIDGSKYRWVIHGDFKGGHYSKQKRPELGDTVLVYQGASDDLRIAEFGIREGKVVWISLSKNE